MSNERRATIANRVDDPTKPEDWERDFPWPQRVLLTTGFEPHTHYCSLGQHEVECDDGNCLNTRPIHCQPCREELHGKYRW